LCDFVQTTLKSFARGRMSLRCSGAWWPARYTGHASVVTVDWVEWYYGRL